MTEGRRDLARAIRDEIEPLSPRSRLRVALAMADGKAVFTTSFSKEDQIVTYFLSQEKSHVDLVTLDTGRHFPEVYDLWAKTEKAFDLKIAAFSPRAEAVKDLVRNQGINGFYDSVENRKACCHVRKVEPLARALSGAKVWITGLRAAQSHQRNSLSVVEYDAARDLIKLNPIVDWNSDKIEEILAAEAGIPVNPLHDKGYPSIGCQPCTRAIMPGEEERAGRWWWENDNQECGLHVGPDGKLVRSKA